MTLAEDLVSGGCAACRVKRHADLIARVQRGPGRKIRPCRARIGRDLPRDVPAVEVVAVVNKRSGADEPVTPSDSSIGSRSVARLVDLPLRPTGHRHGTYPRYAKYGADGYERQG